MLLTRSRFLSPGMWTCYISEQWDKFKRDVLWRSEDCRAQRRLFFKNSECVQGPLIGINLWFIFMYQDKREKMLLYKGYR